MKSWGTLTWSAISKKLCHESGRRDRTTSPVAGSCRIKTSLPSKRNSEGRRTAWLRPLRNSFAVRAIRMLLISTGIYHSILQKRYYRWVRHESDDFEETPLCRWLRQLALFCLLYPQLALWARRMSPASLAGGIQKSWWLEPSFHFMSHTRSKFP